MPARAPLSEIPRADGARTQEGYLGSRQVTLRGILGLDGGSDRETLRNLMDAFTWAHRPGRRDLYRDTDRYLRGAQVESFTLTDTGLSWENFSVRLRCADPYWYATGSADTDTWSGPANGGTRTLENEGAATALPVFTITCGSTGTLSLTLLNDTTGEAFSLAGAVTSGQVVVVDTAAQTVTLAGANRMSYFEGSFWALQPGENDLELTLSGVTLTSVVTAWRKRWL